MKPIKKLILGLAAASLCILTPLPVSADQLDDGVVAYEAGNYAKAMQLFKAEAGAGNSEAAYNTAQLYQYGLGVPKSLSDALYWYEISANGGFTNGQFKVAVFYYNATGVAQDYKKSFKWFKKAAENGDADSAFPLAVSYELGRGTRVSKSKAAKWYLMASDNGDDNSSIRAGKLYEEGDGVKKDIRKAAKLYAKAADNGSHVGRVNIARLYYYGIGVYTDKKEGIRLYKQAAAMGNEHAVEKLESFGTKNDLVGDAAYSAYLKKDFDEAIKIWRDRAQRADVAAMVNLGNIYKDVKQVQDYKKAMGWYKPAVTLGNSEAMVAMGDLYKYGLGVPRNYDEAYKLYGQAVYEDDPNGVYMFATMYDDGYGVEQDTGKAMQMYQIAADMGNTDARDMLKFYRDRKAKKDRWDAMVARLDAIERDKAQKKRRCDELGYKGRLEASRRSGQYYKYSYVPPPGC